MIYVDNLRPGFSSPFVSITSMKRLRPGLETFPLFEDLAGQLRLRADHAVAGEWLSGFKGRNRLPKNRLFCIVAAKQKNNAGCIATDEQSVTMRVGHVYHMPPNLELNLVFNPGMQMLAFHFDCFVFEYFDLCAGLNVISEAACTPQSIVEMTQALYDLHERKDMMRVQAQLMQLFAPFIPGDVKSLREQHRIQSRYQIVVDEIDISGAATRISDIATLMNLSVDQLSKRFRREIGIPLKHYIDHILAKKATEYLRHSNLRIKEISELLHFRDEFTFSRFVKKHTHASPRAYRQMVELEHM